MIWINISQIIIGLTDFTEIAASVGIASSRRRMM